MSTEQLPFKFEFRPALAMDDFVVAPSNREAIAWLDRWAEWPAPALSIYGPPGCGKTHLAHVFGASTGAVLLTPDMLDEADPPILLHGSRFCVLADAGRAAEQRDRAFLHLYNVVSELRGRLLLTSRRPPARWSVALADLRSRVTALPAVAMAEPDDVLIAAVLAKMFSDRQLRVAPGVIEYLVTRMERSFAAARRAVAVIDDAAMAARRNITVPFVREVLRSHHLDKAN
ncbi:MAG: DnaA/Hda family protein [Alphaproteobacteria bacterium]